MDYPSFPVDANLTDDLRKQLDELLDDKTVNQMRAMRSYIESCCSNLESKLHDNCTMEDFEDIKKKSTQNIPTSENY